LPEPTVKQPEGNSLKTGECFNPSGLIPKLTLALPRTLLLTMLLQNGSLVDANVALVDAFGWPFWVTCVKNGSPIEHTPKSWPFDKGILPMDLGWLAHFFKPN
jgi:hypothetical protein